MNEEAEHSNGQHIISCIERAVGKTHYFRHTPCLWKQFSKVLK